MFCNNCGIQCPDDVQFCKVCGARLNTADGGYQPPQKQKTRKQSKQPREKKRSMLPVVLGILLLALAAGAYFLFFAKETVLLPVEREVTNEGSEQVIRWDYDENGKVLSYHSESEYLQIDGGYETEYEYSYDEKGVLIAAEVNINDEQKWEVEYVYDSDGVLQELVGEDRETGAEMEASCDQEGRIETIELINSLGDTDIEIEFSYHDNGVVSERILENPTSGFRVEYEYDESGSVTEQRNYLDDDLQSEVTTEYDENGYMCAYVTYDVWSDIETRIELEPIFDKDGNLTGLMVYVEGGYDEEEVGFEIEFAAEYDGDQLILEAEEIPEELEAEIEELVMEVTFGEDGKVTGWDILVDDETLTGSMQEEEEFRISRNAKRFSVADPYWLVSIFG